MPETITLQLHIQPERQGSYFTLPFNMPENTELFTLAYRYERFPANAMKISGGVLTARQEANIIDLGLIAPDGSQVGASGSDKCEFFISATQATPGYRPCALVPGEWQILVGAYKVAPGGVDVAYELSFTPKHRRLLKGDLHTHTLASDGVHTAAELAWKAARNGLDFVAITDHNQMAEAAALPQVSGVTLIPGVEWTHYQGHANFLGVDRPYDEPFATHTPAQALARFSSARQRGALITVNHPFEEGCGFQFDLNSLPFDCLEVWNGPMRESNLRAIYLWQSLLAAGKKVPACGGSDYHRDTPFIFLGGPTTCVLAQSASTADILSGLRQGHAYLTYAPDGPGLELGAGDAIQGDSVDFSNCKQLEITASGLKEGDFVRVVTASSSEMLVEAPLAGQFRGSYKMKAPGFVRVEILRAFLPGLPLLQAALSNPIYFE